MSWRWDQEKSSDDLVTSSNESRSRKSHQISPSLASHVPIAGPFKFFSELSEPTISPNGKFLYGSNRGHNSIVSYKIDKKTGRLEYIEHTSTGKKPRNFAIDPSGKFMLVANQDSDSIIVFRIDEASGKLTPTASKAEVSMPVCLKFISAF